MSWMCSLVFMVSFFFQSRCIQTTDYERHLVGVNLEVTKSKKAGHFPFTSVTQDFTVVYRAKVEQHTLKNVVGTCQMSQET